MQHVPTAREMYPHREFGLALLVLGILLLIVGVALASYCAGGLNPGGPGYPSGPAVPMYSCYYQYMGAGAVLGFVGFILLIVGLVLMVTRNPVYASTGPYYAPPWPPLPPPPPPLVPSSLIACRGCGRVYHLGLFTFCPNCGSKLSP